MNNLKIFVHTQTKGNPFNDLCFDILIARKWNVEPFAVVSNEIAEFCENDLARYKHVQLIPATKDPLPKCLCF